MAALLHPVSETVPVTPGVAPSSRLSYHLFPAKTKYGGMAIHEALPHPIRVVVLDFPLVTAAG